MLDHPNIIGYYDSFEEDGTLMIEMEYADGGLVSKRHYLNNKLLYVTYNWLHITILGVVCKYNYKMINIQIRIVSEGFSRYTKWKSKSGCQKA